MNDVIPWQTVGYVTLGLIGILGVYVLILNAWQITKKVFGRKPPIDETLEATEKKLRSEIYHSKNSVKKELGERITKVEQELEDIRLDRERKWKELTGEYNELRSTLDYMRGRFDALLKKLEGKP